MLNNERNMKNGKMSNESENDRCCYCWSGCFYFCGSLCFFNCSAVITFVAAAETEGAAAQSATAVKQRQHLRYFNFFQFSLSILNCSSFKEPDLTLMVNLHLYLTSFRFPKKLCFERGIVFGRVRIFFVSFRMFVSIVCSCSRSIFGRV